MAPRLFPLPPTIVLTAAGALVLVGCGGSDAAGGSCEPVTREALDSAYLVHVLGTESGVAYTSDPPTSGPHQASPPLDDVVEDPITRPLQVGILERGDVLLQHDPRLAADRLGELRSLAGPGVIVAPNPELPSPIVATAWTSKQLCERVDVAVVQDFVADRSDRGPED